MKNLLVAQSGGPSVAINATLAGVVEKAMTNQNVGDSAVCGADLARDSHCDECKGQLWDAGCNGDYGGYRLPVDYQYRRCNEYDSQYGAAAAVYQLRRHLAVVFDGDGWDAAEYFALSQGQGKLKLKTGKTF